MKKLISVSLLLAAPLLAGTAQADVTRGEKLHNDQCISCHAARFDNNGAAIYTREDRRVNSLAGLKKQVNRCKNNLSIQWFDDEVQAVTDYLNATYYHFEE
ncbi:MAG: cytochrome c [Pseudomonadota bacterium]